MTQASAPAFPRTDRRVTYPDRAGCPLHRSRLNGWAIFALTLALFWLPVAGRCDTTPRGKSLVITADAQFAYAEQRFRAGDFAAATAEYHRFINFFPDDTRVEQARFRIGEGLFLTGLFKQAIPVFSAITDRYVQTDPADSPTAVSAYWMISHCYVRLGTAGAAVTALENLVKLTGDVNTRDAAWYRIAWIHIDGATWHEAQAALGRISPANRDRYRLKTLSDELGRTGGIEKKDPKLAGFLSIIPGLGQVYCHRYRDALVAFVINGALMAVTYEAFDNGNEALGGTVGFLGMGFYAGNIYNAANSARKFNRSRTMQFIEKLKADTRIDLSTDWHHRRVVLALQFAF